MESSDELLGILGPGGNVPQRCLVLADGVVLSNLSFPRACKMMTSKDVVREEGTEPARAFEPCGVSCRLRLSPSGYTRVLHSVDPILETQTLDPRKLACVVRNQYEIEFQRVCADQCIEWSNRGAAFRKRGANVAIT